MLEVKNDTDSLLKKRTIVAEWGRAGVGIPFFSCTGTAVCL